VRFPITGGNVTVYAPGTANPYVQGRIEHDGSGLSLTKGDTEVRLTDVVVDPGNPATLSGKVSAGGQTSPSPPCCSTSTARRSSRSRPTPRPARPR
jgi:hypothetical protein